jgi:hypothetical protein
VELHIEERISPRILTNLMQNFRNAAEAIFEIVDNSVDAAAPASGYPEGRKLRIEIEWAADRIVVTDRGGRGMGLATLRRFFRWGESEKELAEGALGRFGQGGKAAMGYLARSFTITAKAAGEAHGYRVSDRDYRDRAGGTKRYRAERVELDVPRREGYVQIRLANLNRRRIDARALGQRIADVYGELIMAGKCTIVLNGQELEPAPLPLDGARSEVDIRLPTGKHVFGWFGRLEPDVAKKGRLRGGMRLCVHGRLITDGEFFGHRGPWFKQSLNQLIGVLEMAPVRVNMNKTDFDRDSDEWAFVQAHMHEQLAPLIQDLIGSREAEKVTRSDWRRVRHAQRLVERALVQLDLDDLLPLSERPRRRRLAAIASMVPQTGVEPAPGEGPAVVEGHPLPLFGEMLATNGHAANGHNGAANGTNGHHGATTNGLPNGTERPYPPAVEGKARVVPLPPRYSGQLLGSRLRRHRVNWEPRPLTEEKRSDWEEVDGQRTLLINTRFPLYRETKGDVWYIVETGVFELTRRIRPGELTVDEYYDEVNRILQHAAEAREEAEDAVLEPVAAAAAPTP